MRIPYGIANFERIRNDRYFYADKTHFLPMLEDPMAGYAYLMFLRPRRFGKSTLVSMMAHYYDIKRADQFDELFRGLWIHDNPTEERNKYLTLALDFSPVSSEGSQDFIRKSFAGQILASIESFVTRYGSLVPALHELKGDIKSADDDSARLFTRVFRILEDAGQKMYLLIDEYDHFANRLLGEGHENVYTSVVTGTGFVRSFFAALKVGAGVGVLARVFLTGVTPIMLDDMTSGFNITTNISMKGRFNALAGFTRTDVERAIEEFLVARPQLTPHLADRDKLFETLEMYYDGYRFSSDATERMFNSDMVLYFLRELEETQRFPEDLLDRNVRTTYEQLQRIGAAGGAAAKERRELLISILDQKSIRSEITDRFGMTTLASDLAFVSLLFYMGMLTFRDVPRTGMAHELEIPNRVIRLLQWEYLGLALKQQERFAISMGSLESALSDLAIRGHIQPLLEAFKNQILQHVSIKDTQNLDEKTIKLLLMMFVSLGRVFYALSEKEFSQGYCDLFLSAARNVPGLNYSWLLELKYLKANANEAQIEKAFAEAAQQVDHYSKDPTLLPMLVGDYQLKCGRIVFVGIKRMLFRAWPDDLPEKRVEVVVKPIKKVAAKKSAAKKVTAKKATAKKSTKKASRTHARA